MSRRLRDYGGDPSPPFHADNVPTAELGAGAGTGEYFPEEPCATCGADALDGAGLQCACALCVDPDDLDPDEGYRAFCADRCFVAFHAGRRGRRVRAWP